MTVTLATGEQGLGNEAGGQGSSVSGAVQGHGFAGGSKEKNGSDPLTLQTLLLFPPLLLAAVGW